MKMNMDLTKSVVWTILDGRSYILSPLGNVGVENVKKLLNDIIVYVISFFIASFKCWIISMMYETCWLF